MRGWRKERVGCWRRRCDWGGIGLYFVQWGSLGRCGMLTPLQYSTVEPFWSAVSSR